MPSKKLGIIGKVCVTKNMPTNTNNFTFWLKETEKDLQVGDIVVAIDGKEKTYGLVTQMNFYTDSDSIFSEYYSHDFGMPEAIPPTERSKINLVLAEVIGSNTNKIRPVKGGIIRLALPEEIREAYNMDKIEDPIVCGIVQNGPNPEMSLPVVISEKYVTGPEGAHINISGASGLATKTSAAIFLATSILCRAKRENRKVAVVGFNLKSEDLLFLERNNDRDDKILNLLPPQDFIIYKKVKDAGIDLYVSKEKIRYFAPAMKYKPNMADSLARNKKEMAPEVFYWTYGNVKDPACPIRLFNLLDPIDLDEKTIGVLASIDDVADNEGLDTFSDIIEFLKTKALTGRNWRGHHPATLSKVRQRIEVTTKELLRGLFSYDSKEGKDLPIETLASEDFWIIDIQSLNDKGKRIVFFNVVDRLARMLEDEKVKDEDDKKFQSIIVFVDELNKFAPSGSYSSPIKERIVDIAARGRSIGLVLIGAQQFASGVEREIFGNTATHIVGRSELSELRDSAYSWISGDLKNLVASLPKGSLLLRHCLFTRPIVIKFPRPLYTYLKSDIERLVTSKTAQTGKDEEIAGDIEPIFTQLKKIVKRKKINANSIFSGCYKLKHLGIDKQTFINWFNFWRENSKFKKGSNVEQNALYITINFLQTK